MDRKQLLQDIQASASHLPKDHPTVTWKTIKQSAKKYPFYATSENLLKLVDQWETYWSWSWGESPPNIEFLINIWEKIVQGIEFKHDEGSGHVCLYQGKA